MVKFRKHIRLKGFDYSQNHYYFVTICTDFREGIFVPKVSEKCGHHLDEDVVAEFTLPNPEAQRKTERVTDIVEKKLLKLPERFPNLEIDFYVFMPDHIHMVLAIRYVVAKFTLPRIIQAFKSLATREAKQALQLPSGERIFQPNYYEHIIRSEDSLGRIRNYIFQNPQVEYDEINWKFLDPSL